MLEALRIYLEYALQGTYLSCEELAPLTSSEAEEIYSAFREKDFSEKILKEGVPLPPLRLTRDSLSEKQLRWIRAASNPYSQKNLNLLASENDVTIEEHQSWLLRPHFRKAYERRVGAQAQGAKGEVIRRTMNKAVQGDQKAVENYFKIIGEPLQALEESNSMASLPMGEIMAVLQRVLSQEDLAAVALAFMAKPKELTQGQE